MGPISYSVTLNLVGKDSLGTKHSTLQSQFLSYEEKNYSGWKPTHPTSVNIHIRTYIFITSWYYANCYIRMSVGKIQMLDRLVSTHPENYALWIRPLASTFPTWNPCTNALAFYASSSVTTKKGGWRWQHQAGQADGVSSVTHPRG
jgi:hypothetical protein